MRFVPLSEIEEEDKPFTFVPLESIKTEAPAPKIRTPEPVSIPATGDAMGGDFGSAIMDVAAPAKTSTSVLEGRTFLAQPEIDRRLSYGAGPISRETAVKADLLRSGVLTTEDKTVKKAAAGMAETKTPSFADLIERANNPVNVRAARDAKADEFRTFGEWAVDQLAGPLAQGAVSLVQLPTNIVAPGSSLAQTLRETQKELQAQESDVMKAQRDQMRERIQSEEGFFGKYLATVESLVTNPALGLSEAAKQVPNFLGVMGLAKVGTAVAGGGVGLATKVSPAVALSEAISGGALQAGARTAGATAGGLTATTVMTAGDAAGNVYEKLIDPKQTPPSVWQENPDYQKLIAEGKTPAQAIDEIATAKARLAAIITAPLGALGFMGAEAAIVARGAGKALTSVATPKGAAKLFGKELIGEQLEEGGTQLGANIIAQTVDKEQKLLEGVPEAMATAAVTSAPFSGVAVGQQVRDALNRPVAPFDIVGDTLARRALDVQSYDANIISPVQTAKIAQAQQDLGQASTAADAVAAAENLAGSVDELLVPGSAVTPLPRIEPTLTNELPPVPAVELPPVSTQVEQQFGLDKLRLNAPRPQRIQGEPVANLTDDQLTALAGDETVPAITRRSAAIEITARQAEQTAQQAPITPAPLPTPAQAAQAAVGAPIESRTYTAEELGKMRLGDRRTLAQQFDQVENQDGSVTFTPKPAAQAATPGAAPVPGGFVSIPETQAVSDAAAPTVAGLPDANRARAAAQTTLNRWAAANGVDAPRLNAPAPAQEAAVNEIASALNSQFGGRLVAFTDSSPTSINGVAIGGTAFVNTAGDVNALRTSLHEFKHTVEQIAAAETSAGLTDTPAQKFTASIDSVFDDMTDEGKRAYVENFLHRDELIKIADPDAREQRVQQLLTSDTLKSEMTADFLGNRATDKAFWADVAKADPQGFKGFVNKWVGIIDNLLQTLRGSKDQGQKESAKVDKYIRDLNRAKMVARDALVAYNKGTLGAVDGQRVDVIARSQIQPSVAGAIGQLSEAGGGGPAPSYGTARQGAVSVIGRHYSTAPRQTLSGAYYGRGLKGAERNRLDSSPDPRLKNRIYFYVDEGAGIRPESGVGGIAHEVKLDNIYDPKTRLIKPQADANAFESAVINAGFDGYIAPFGNNQSAVVLLGMKHKAVPVRALGQVPSAAAPEAAAPTKLTKGLLSREANAIDVTKIPGAQVRMGNLEIPADQAEAANTELERIGSDVRFAKKQQGKTIGDYQVTTEKDGSIKVTGNPEAIRALMPEGVTGRVLADGVAFTNANAPRVRAALEGRKLAYSRGGTVLERLPVKDGKYLGAPEKFNTPAKIPTLRRWLRQLADEGAPGRYWYENSGKEVLKMVGGDVQEARKFVALLAIYSPQAKVDANSTFALRAWAQYKAGQPISVKTGVMDEKAKKALDNVDEFWSGEKTGNFFFNLLREIDPSTEGKQGATIDMWMMRAGQYDTDAPTSTQYAFMENETNRLAQELGWEPQQVQAAIWVAMKARMENSGVKKATEASSEKKGWIRFDNKVDPQTGKKSKVRVILNEKAHRDNWLKHSFDHDPSTEDTQMAKFDFGDGLKRHIGQVSFEARPGRSTGVLPGIHDAPYAQQVEFQQAVQAAFLDETGADRLAQLLGLLVDTNNVLAPGVWQGEVSPSSQKLVAMAPAKGKAGQTEVDPAQAEALNLYAAVAGLVARQEGVGWHRAFYAGTKRDANGLDIDLGRVINPAEAADLERAIGVWMDDNKKADWQNSFAMISSPNGIRLISFGIIDNPTLQSEIVKVAESVLPDFDYRAFASSGDMPTNNWKENPNGEGYLQRLSAAGRSDVLDWARTVLAPRVQSVFDEYSKKYDWGDPGSISFSKRQPDLETIFDGLNKRGLAKTRAQAALDARPDAAQLQYVQDNFIDILSELDDSGLVKINCD